MSFWKKGSGRAGSTLTAAAPPPSPVLHGFLPCSAGDCVSHDAVQCAYVDRRGQPCLTAWCPAHQVAVAGRCFCRRHARLSNAVRQGEFRTGRALPDLGNRAPSLVVFVSDALEPRILEFLHAQLRPGGGETLGSESLNVNRPPSGGHRWARSWQIYDHTGTIVKVSVEVDEASEIEVTVRVGQHLVAGGVPPWISRRRQGLAPLPADAERIDRERFFESLFAPIVPRVLGDLAAPHGRR